MQVKKEIDGISSSMYRKLEIEESSWWWHTPLISFHDEIRSEATYIKGSVREVWIRKKEKREGKSTDSCSGKWKES